MQQGQQIERLALQPLIEHQLIQPGVQRLSCAVAGSIFYGDLKENGEIWFDGIKFKSPSAFSVHIKRIFNPSRKADDGWTSVKYGGQLLSSFKQELNRILGVEQKPRKASFGLPAEQPKLKPIVQNVKKGSMKKRNRQYESFASDEVDDYDSESEANPSLFQKQKNQVYDSSYDGTESYSKALNKHNRTSHKKQLPKNTKHQNNNHKEHGQIEKQINKNNSKSDNAQLQQNKDARDLYDKKLIMQNIQASHKDPVHKIKAGQQNQIVQPDENQQKQNQINKMPGKKIKFIVKKKIRKPQKDQQDSNNGVDQQDADGETPFLEKFQKFYKPQQSWVECENCHKWRQVQNDLIQEYEGQPWYCELNQDESYNNCEIEQALSADEIDEYLTYEQNQHYINELSKRPKNIHECTDEQFETDVYSFLMFKREHKTAKQVKQKQIMCNNSPLDIFGLYKNVLNYGGILATEKYEGGRWIGQLNFGGQIFPKMKNYTPNNRATSVGNQLLNNYRKLLYQYEKAYQYIDLKDNAVYLSFKQQQQSGINVEVEYSERVIADSDEEAKQQLLTENAQHDVTMVDFIEGHSDLSENELDQQSESNDTQQEVVERHQEARQVHKPQAHQHHQQQNQVQKKVQKHKDRQNIVTQGLCLDALAEQALQFDQNKKQQKPLFETEEQVYEARAKERLAYVKQAWSFVKCPNPGDIFLAQDPNNPTLHWPVIFSDLTDLSYDVATGGAMRILPYHFPQTVDEILSHKQNLQQSKRGGGRVLRQETQKIGSLQDMVAVVVCSNDNSGNIGWVDKKSLRPFTSMNGEAAMMNCVKKMQARTLQSQVEDPQPIVTQQEQQQYETTQCFRALRFALQYWQNAEGHPLTGINLVRQRSIQISAQKLLEFESLLLPHCVCCDDFQFWQSWRRQTLQAMDAQQLSQQVLALAFQLDKEMQKKGAQDNLWQELRYLLGIQQYDFLNNNKSHQQNSIYASLQKEWPQVRGPTPLLIDESIQAMKLTIDWSKVLKNIKLPQAAGKSNILDIQWTGKQQQQQQQQQQNSVIENGQQPQPLQQPTLQLVQQSQQNQQKTQEPAQINSQEKEKSQQKSQHQDKSYSQQQAKKQKRSQDRDAQNINNINIQITNNKNDMDIDKNVNTIVPNVEMKGVEHQLTVADSLKFLSKHKFKDVREYAQIFLSFFESLEKDMQRLKVQTQCMTCENPFKGGDQNTLQQQQQNDNNNKSKIYENIQHNFLAKKSIQNIQKTFEDALKAVFSQILCEKCQINPQKETILDTSSVINDTIISYLNEMKEKNNSQNIFEKASFLQYLYRRATLQQKCLNCTKKICNDQNCIQFNKEALSHVETDIKQEFEKLTQLVQCSSCQNKKNDDQPLRQKVLDAIKIPENNGIHKKQAPQIKPRFSQQLPGYREITLKTSGKERSYNDNPNLDQSLHLKEIGMSKISDRNQKSEQNSSIQGDNVYTGEELNNTQSMPAIKLGTGREVNQKLLKQQSSKALSDPMVERQPSQYQQEVNQIIQT